MKNDLNGWRAIAGLLGCAAFLAMLVVSVSASPSRISRARSTNSFGQPARIQSVVQSSPPAVVASTYFGGSGFEITWSCATDAAGNVFIAGDAQAADFPVTQNAFQKTYGDGGQDGFVAKFDKNGKLLWSTFLGGSGWDGVFALALDGSGNAVVTGVTESTDFPITANAIQSTLPAGVDAAFVTVISADGTHLIYSTFLGGSIGDNGTPLPVNVGHILPNGETYTLGVGVAVGNDGTIYVVGGTDTIDLPVTNGAAQPVIGGGEDGFAARIDPEKSGMAGLVYCTFVGGLMSDFAAAVAVDSTGNAYVTGETQSQNFPTTSGAFQTGYKSGTDAFVTKLNATGTADIYSTLVSGTQGSSAAAGTNYNAPSAIVIDRDGHAYIVGETNATDFPTTAGVLQRTNAGQDDGFVTELSADGSSLVFSTYLGGSDYDGFFGIKLDSSGNIFVDGYSASRDAPLVRAFQPAMAGYYDAWVAELSPGGTTLLLSSDLGGNDQDSAYAIDLWNDQVYIAGRTASTDFPTTSSAVQPTYGGGVWDNFVTILNLSPVQLNGVVSRLTHGSAGPFDIDLRSAIECRSGGSNGDYTIVLTFADRLTSVADATIASGSASIVSSSIDSNDAHNYVVRLTAVEDAQQLNIALENVGDSAGNFSATVSVTMRILIGDTNNDGLVNSADIGQSKSQSGQPVTSANFREDVNGDGFINSGDIGLVKSKSGTALP